MSSLARNRLKLSGLERLRDLMRADGWDVPDSLESGMAARKGASCYAVEVLHSSEARPDRVLALLSQGILQAIWRARKDLMSPLAVICVDQIPDALRNKVAAFVGQYAPDVAVGLLSVSDDRFFIGDGLSALNVSKRLAPVKRLAEKSARAPSLFSDLNQWLLKVLLAPEIPERLMYAPRAEYRSAAELAEAADVSPMSVSRFLRRLDEEGCLDVASGFLRVVRREHLFRRWQAWSMEPPAEVKMRYRSGVPSAARLQKVVEPLDAYVGLFAAAEALGVGHVSGVPSYVLIPYQWDQLPAGWRGLDPAGPGERVDVIVRQARAPRSVINGAVRPGNGMVVSDVLQVWLDVSAHPSRGAEQARFLERGPLKALFSA